MVWKLLRKNISFLQIAGYALASLVGLSIVICAVKFYCDVQTAFDGEESFLSKDYIIISKSVGATSTLGMNAAPTTFSDADLDDLRKQSWVRDIGAFESAGFNVEAIMRMGNRGMSTHLFLEAIPDRFLDVTPPEWTNVPSIAPEKASSQDLLEYEIPVIMSRDYLTLYNFGFAAARGLPQLNEGVAQSIPLTFELAGNGYRDIVRARIVGFSSRLNTIAVPEAFLDWANRRYSPSGSPVPSRLIIEANTPGDPAISQYMQRNSYQVAGDKADNSRASYFLAVATGIVLTVGVVITLLALFVLMLSIYLLLQKNQRMLHYLMLLGYSPGNVSRPYYVLVLAVNLVVALLSVAVMMIASTYWVDALSAIDVSSASPLWAILVAIIVCIFVTAINCLAIHKIVRRNFFE